MKRVTALLIALFLLPVAAQARNETGSFAVYIGGIRAGTLGYSFAVEGDRYRVRGRAEASGLINLFYEATYVTESAGRIVRGRYLPDYYREARGNRRGTERAEFLFRNHVPQPKTYDPPRGPETLLADPADQGGTVDPMTAAFAIMRDTPRDAVCGVDLQVWDGERRGLIRLSGPRADDGDLICDGLFRRLDGYTEKDLREQRDFPFTVRYGPGPDGLWQMLDARAPSSAGRVVMQRR